ncbi:MAG: MBL fold metallo-hydrolase [Deltaproteobacteria bacterium]|nr:MBL fold metallo-hydrolase [Deltaproteobacteria bacterium]
MSHQSKTNVVSVIEAAARAMGATSLQSIQYSGTGSVFVLGQAPGPGKPWPRFNLIKYVATVNYNAPIMREELVRTEIEDPPRGGGAGPYNPATGQGGIRPIPFGPQTQIRQATPATETGLLQIWMTPHGFLKAAGANDATATTANAGGRTVDTVSFTALGKYTVSGTIDDENLLTRVETRNPNTVLGDMLVETTYSDYRDFAGVKFPTRIVQRQAGHRTLDLTVNNVHPNSAAAAALEVAASAQPGTAPPLRAEAREVAGGLWDVGGDQCHSYLVEFADHLVVIEAPGNDARANAVIAEVKRAVPDKPIRYLVNTHHHFDHAGGVRRFVAEGITIITHEMNKPYYEEIFRNPNRLNPDRLALSNRTAVIEGVGDKRVLTDGAMTMELYHIRGNLHDEAMLMVYLPKERLLIQTDAHNPRPPEARPLPSISPFTVNLFENIQRLKLDVAQIAHIHGGVIEPFAALAKVAGRQE